jgi:predicted phage-related endonuclease
MTIVLASTIGLPYKEWLAYRRLGIGGSDASVICGINRWKSPVELWMEKTGQHPEYGPCVFEAKTASAFKADEWDDAIPDEYQLQIQHYMSVTGYKGTYIAVLIGGNTFKWFFIKRDDDLIDKLIHLERDFWRGVQEKVPPPLDGSDASARFIGERFPNSVPLSRIDLPVDAADLLRQYDAAGEKVEHYAGLKQEAENLLKQLMGEHEVGTAGERVLTWKSVTQERLDSKAFKAKHPKLFRRYANKTSHRRFAVN